MGKMEEMELMERMHFYYLACERMRELCNNAQNEKKIIEFHLSPSSRGINNLVITLIKSN